jgi:hypothetical protein
METPPHVPRVVRYIWKGYPYEYLAGEPLGNLLFGSSDTSDDSLPSSSSSSSPRSVHLIEPPWKIILGNKAILALLWELSPNHPNLLYSTYDRQEALRYSLQQQRAVVSKPKYGREGNGIRIHRYEEGTSRVHGVDEMEESWSEKEGSGSGVGEEYYGEAIYQEFHDIERFHGRKMVIGSWMVRGKPAGVCIREDVSEITNDNSSIVPHYVSAPRRDSSTSISRPGSYSPAFPHDLPALSEKHKLLRKKLYPEEDFGLSSRAPRGGHGSGGGGGGWWWWRNSSSSAETKGPSSGTSEPSSKAQPSSSSTSANADNIRSKAKSYHSKRWSGASRAGPVGRKFGSGAGRGSS